MDMDPSSGGTLQPLHHAASAPRALSRTPSWAPLAPPAAAAQPPAAPSPPPPQLQHSAPANLAPASSHLAATLTHSASTGQLLTSEPSASTLAQRGASSAALQAPPPAAAPHLDPDQGLLGSSMADLTGSLNLWNSGDRVGLAAAVSASNNGGSGGSRLGNVAGSSGRGQAAAAGMSGARLRAALPPLPTPGGGAPAYGRVSGGGGGGAGPPPPTPLPAGAGAGGGGLYDGGATAAPPVAPTLADLTTSGLSAALAPAGGSGPLRSPSQDGGGGGGSFSLPPDAPSHHSLPHHPVGGQADGIPRQHSAPAAGRGARAAAAAAAVAAGGAWQAPVGSPLLLRQTSGGGAATGGPGSPVGSGSIAASVARQAHGGEGSGSHGASFPSPRQGSFHGTGGVTTGASAIYSQGLHPPAPAPAAAAAGGGGGGGGGGAGGTAPHQSPRQTHHGSVSPWAGRSAENTALTSQVRRGREGREGNSRVLSGEWVAKEGGGGRGETRLSRCRRGGHGDAA